VRNRRRAALSPAPPGCRGTGVFGAGATDDLLLSVPRSVTSASPGTAKGAKLARKNALPNIQSGSYVCLRRCPANAILEGGHYHPRIAHALARNYRIWSTPGMQRTYSAVGTLHPRRRPSPWVHATWHVACSGSSCVVWKDRQPPCRSPPAPRLFLSRLSLHIHARHGYGARGERGTRTERGASEERARSASGRHQLGGHGAGREAQRKRARAQEGARQEGASTGGREHRRRKLRGVRASEMPKEPANNPQSLRVKPPKFRNSFSFRVHLQVTVILFMTNVLINPQTTCKLPANVNSGLPNAVTSCI
jgi:hypothetical protein